MLFVFQFPDGKAGKLLSVSLKNQSLRYTPTHMEQTNLNWSVSDLKLDVDAVLRGQGADPGVIRSRRPRLVEIAEQALESSRYLLEPRVVQRRLAVRSLRHEKLILEGGSSLSGAWISQYLAPAESVTAIVCTVGSRIEQAASRLMESDMLLGLALDGVGSAGVEALAQLVCKQIEDQAAAEGKQTSVPLSPGMLNWSVEDGQPVIFEMLAPAQIGVEMTSSFMMKPGKSLSMLVGVGTQLGVKGNTCDYCAMQGTCKYREYGGHTQMEANDRKIG
ncbi:MAG: hypothetical protein A2X25_10045 [Chloroflexi bacterium GWB2_49_20]|nr:MAG: hypothetical protein A2X25_10045 [Chloroflexi bacterium GWB2_49_20]OGN79239.1 MAG: hypothetical protein A2X26_03975 [Chloroflexi bacterium GWC2_49_37]OGN82991.1 MAG: hypothetical protein A2X27_08720 [Chloroflexi bacterium GWD2_49_16]HCC78649.1 hypothetical protein [Anaerolineae bacterium]